MSADLPSFPVTGSSILVAGATGGLGREIARELHQRGAELTLVARDAGRLGAIGIPGHQHVADLRLPESSVDAVAAARAHGNGLNVVINAVGVVAFGSVDELSIDAMEELFLTNTFLPIMLAKAALSVLEPGGVIVNISGVIAEKNMPGMAAYGASKAALRSFDEGLAREARRRKIRVIDARPPHTETGLAGRAIEGTAPNMPEGLEPHRVATIICDAIESGAVDLPACAF